MVVPEDFPPPEGEGLPPPPDANDVQPTQEQTRLALQILTLELRASEASLLLTRLVLCLGAFWKGYRRICFRMLPRQRPCLNALRLYASIFRNLLKMRNIHSPLSP